MESKLKSHDFSSITTNQFGLAGAAFTQISSYQYWSLTFDYPDLVKHFHLQVRIMGNFGLNGRVPWLDGANESTCYICQEGS